MNYFTPMNVLDPTIATEEEPIDYAPRPADVQGLRIGIIENTKKNAEAVLTKLTEKLKSAYAMKADFLLAQSLSAHRSRTPKLPNCATRSISSSLALVTAAPARPASSWTQYILRRPKIPAIGIVTDAFDNTSREMAELWGVPNFRFVKIPHPLASLTPEQVDQRAQELVGKVVSSAERGTTAISSANE